MPGALWTIEEIQREILALSDSAGYQKPDFYRSFTRRLKELLGDFQVLKGDDTLRTVDIIYANPERAVAKITEQKTTILPLLSLQFEGVAVDTARQRPLPVLVEKSFWDAQRQRAVRYMALAPLATTLSFGINIWGKYVEEVNQLTEQVMLKFRPNMPVDVREDEIYQAFIQDVSEASDLVVSDQEDRLVKRTVRFEVQSYIPSQVFRFTNTSEIKTMNYELYVKEISELEPLESFYAGGGAEFALDSGSSMFALGINRGAEVERMINATSTTTTTS